MKSILLGIYDRLILGYPRVWLGIVALTLAVSGLYVQHFKLDASADSLILENDKDLRYHRAINKKYGTEDFLVITYTPFGELLSEESLDGLRGLKKDLSQLERIDSVVSILDVPLLNSPRIKISELESNKRTLETPGVDKELARKELTESPIYRKLLASPDGKTTAILAMYKRDETYYSLLEERNGLRQKKRDLGRLTGKEEKRLREVSLEFKEYLGQVQDYQGKEIEEVRAILDKYRDRADIFLGGLPMITSDMIDFIRSDLSVFGIGVFCLMVVVMWFFFRRVRWVVLPLFCSAFSAWIMVGYLGFLDWRVTVISSNFISILTIVTISLTIHLIVSYGELYAENPNMDQGALVSNTIKFMFQPCFYTAITTIVAFSSLVVSGIRPVIDFGWIMTIGISLAFILSFIFFPSFLKLMSPKESVSSHDTTRRLTHAIALFTLGNKNKILGLSAILVLWSIAGVFQLQVDNRFIDYFKKTTEIYQGMSVIDTQLGGTTPLSIIIDADRDFYEYLKEVEIEKAEEELFDDPFKEIEEEEEENYWFNADKLLEVETIHDYLESLPQIGKVLSIATTLKMVRLLNKDRVPDDYDLTLYRKLFPADAKKTFLDPYLSKDANQIRITLRIEETNPTLNRGELMDKIKRYLVEERDMAENRIHFTGMAVLYNNMLHSLYKSQIMTLEMVFIMILIMFMILFRGVYMALLAIVPNVLSAGVILGLMGWLGIPLDMMTITIAAITIGIAVDDTIHYVHRFKREFSRHPNYKDDVLRCHESIGRAIYYTSITVTVGFSILTLSNFIPTIYFGFLTGIAMVIALISNLTLLPLLIVVFRPLGPEINEVALSAT
ncbi:membrane protein [Candidatus Nitromaritima sp. SCGC AAA799-C22]|nr:membrane protein [Candidatus Nitromaritima sp. SCGC AAA799-C22]